MSSLNSILGEAAWTAIRTSPHGFRQPRPWQAIARELLVVIWQVLTEHAADWQADPVAVARACSAL